MIDERYVELINKELDGLNTESESKELKHFLSAHNEALKYYNELLRTASALRRIDQVEPPSFLKTHILNSVKSLPVPVRSRFGWTNSVLDVFRRRPVVRYGAVFASGLCVGILLLVIADPWRQNEMPHASKLSGSMLSRPDISRLQMIDSIALDGSGYQGHFRTFRGDGTLTVECVVAAGENLELELSSDPEELKFVGVHRLGGADNDVTVTAGKVVFTGTKSEHDMVTFTNVVSPHQPIEVRLYKGGTVITSVLVRTN